MKSTITKAIKEKIKANESEYAHNWIVEQYQLSLEKQDEAEIAKARLKMSECEERIKWLKTLLKKESAE